MDEDGGVLDNLPRSRPGTRSKRRTQAGGMRPVDSAERAAQSAERSGRPAARAARSATPGGAGGAAAPRAGSARGAQDEQVRTEASPDHVGDAVRAAAKLAGTGLRVTAGLAQEVLRRLPRS
jgi:hypothetical protein